MNKKYGIDISQHQGDIDLSKINPEFVIIRGGYSTKKDPKFDRNVRECQRLGIPFGVYWYSYALNADQARAEAWKCLEVIKGLDIKVGVWFDMEDADHWKANKGFTFTKQSVSPIVFTFCDIVESNGYYTGVYMSKSWFRYLDSTCDRFDKWVASWGNNDGGEHDNTSAIGSMLQYTSAGRLDKNVAYFGLDRYDLNKKPTPKPNPEPNNKEKAIELLRQAIDLLGG